MLFTSWLYCFDRLNVEALFRQIDCAAEMGIEAFMIDAGWFGKGEDWSKSVGDREENTVSGPMCFSCDLDAFPAEYKERWKSVIAQYKQDREFYKTATERTSGKTVSW